MPIKLIAMDMDGTLLLPNPARYPQAPISPAVLSALQAAHHAGIHLALASGRIPDDAGFFAVDAKLPMHILALNGGCMLMEPFGPIIQSHPLPVDTALALHRLLNASGVLYGIFGGHELIISAPEVSEKDLNLLWGTYLKRKGGRTIIRCGGLGAEALCRTGANKLLVISDHPETLTRLRQQIEAAFPQMEIASSWVNNLELNPRGVNKGLALQELTERLGISLADTMAIGDNLNDLPMLTLAGCSVAMGNSVPEVLSCARFRTFSNMEDGVARAIRALALSEQVEGVVCLH